MIKAIAVGVAVSLVGSACLAAAGPFAISSSTFPDGGHLTLRQAGKNPNIPTCAGENVSPALAWENVPAEARSLAVVVYDPDGRFGLGSTHWVAYGIPVTVKGFAEGEMALAATAFPFTRGRGSAGLSTYLGPCPPAGTTDHHYLFSVMATDLATDALPPGLTREELLARLEGHVKAGASLVARFRHP